MYCGFEYQDGVKFCPSCGKKTVIPPMPASENQEQTITCSGCGKQIKKGIKFCNFCGCKVQENTPPAPAENNDPKNAGSEDTITCSGCGKQIKKGIKFCNFCGLKVQENAPAAPAEKNNPKNAGSEDTITCSNCGKQVRKGIKFCNFCGYKIKDAVPDKKPGLFSGLPVVPTADQHSDKQTTVSPDENSTDRKIADAVAKEEAKPDKKDAVNADDSRICSCGGVLKPGAKFCPKCGKKYTGTTDAKPDTAPADALSEEKTEQLDKPGDAEPSTEVLPTVTLDADSPERKLVDEFLKEEAEKNKQPDNAPAEPVTPEMLPTVTLDANSPERKLVDEFLKQEAEKNKDDSGDIQICSCGNKLKPGAKFCPKCGKKVGEKAEEKTTTLPEIKAAIPSSEMEPTVTLAADSEERKMVDAFLKEEAGKEKQNTPAPDAPVICSCGNKLNPGAKFCTKCGKKIGDSSSAPAAPIPSTSTVSIPVSTEQQGFAASAPAAPRKPLSKKAKIIIASCGAGLLVLLTIIIILVNATPTIHLSEYITMEYEGYSGYGTMKASFDADRFRADWMGKLRYQSFSMDVPSHYYDFTVDPSETILSSVRHSYSFDKSSSLSNDDKIKLHWSLDQTKYYLEKAIKVNIDTADTEFTVANLKTIGSFDPFGGLTIRYTGYNGNGVPEIGSSNYSLVYSFDKTSGLKNGDTLHVTVSSPYGDDLAKYCASSMGAVPSSTGKDYIVEGLPEMQGFDPFEGISVTFEGVAPDGKAVLNNDSNKNLRYELDKKEGLSNGDKVTVTVTAPYGEDLESYCKENYEAKPNATTKVFTVNTLGKYITAIDELPAATLETLKTESKDRIESDITDDVESVEKIDYEGMIMLNLKDGKNSKSKDNWNASSDHDHMLFLVYKVTARIKDRDDKNMSYSYWTACRFNDITLLPDGSCDVDTNEIVIPGDTVSSEKSYKSFRGYESYDQLFKKIVNTRLTDYKYETKTSDSEQSSGSSQASQVSTASSEPVSQPSQISSDTSETSADTSQSSTQESSAETTSAAESSQTSSAA